MFDWFNNVNNMNLSSNSEAYGVSLNNLLSVAIAFLNASGFGPALLNAFTLGVSLFFSYFSIKISYFLAKKFIEVARYIQESVRTIDS